MTSRTQADQVALTISEIRYRRLFETAKDGILLLDADTGRITDANPYLQELLGIPRRVARQDALGNRPIQGYQGQPRRFQEIAEEGVYPLRQPAAETKGRKRRYVEFVSNVYQENGTRVIHATFATSPTP